jgi:hypothetical protein
MHLPLGNKGVSMGAWLYRWWVEFCALVSWFWTCVRWALRCVGMARRVPMKCFKPLRSVSSQVYLAYRRRKLHAIRTWNHSPNLAPASVPRYRDLLFGLLFCIHHF